MFEFVSKLCLKCPFIAGLSVYMQFHTIGSDGSGSDRLSDGFACCSPICIYLITSIIMSTMYARTLLKIYKWEIASFINAVAVDTFSPGKSDKPILEILETNARLETAESDVMRNIIILKKTGPPRSAKSKLNMCSITFSWRLTVQQSRRSSRVYWMFSLS